MPSTNSLKVISFEDTSNESAPKTKAEKKAERIKKNRDWKIKTKMAGVSGDDPNPRHSKYYKIQLPFLIDEWDEFQLALARELPVTFRFSNTCTERVRTTLEQRMMKAFRTMSGRFVEINGNPIQQDILTKVPWINAFQIGIGSSSLSRNIGLKPLSDFISQEVELGNIIRQELVSMIPANLLDIHEHHMVLDMCSAPGSKTEEALTLMKAQCSASAHPTGFVLANDADPKRIKSIQRRYSRSGSPNLIITCSRAEKLHEKLNGMQFDRIICDVPCTGDGTFRKCPHLWRLFRL